MFSWDINYEVKNNNFTVEITTIVKWSKLTPAMGQIDIICPLIWYTQHFCSPLAKKCITSIKSWENIREIPNEKHSMKKTDLHFSKMSMSWKTKQDWGTVPDQRTLKNRQLKAMHNLGFSSAINSIIKTMKKSD